MYEYVLWAPLGGTHSTKLVEFDGISWPYTNGSTCTHSIDDGICWL